MTGLPNRAYTLHLPHGALSRAQRGGRLIALLFIDVDGFKTANEDHGHRVGDQVLRVMTQRLKAEPRAGDTVGRLGGDELVVVLDGVANERVAVDVGNRIVDAAAQPIHHEYDHPVRVGASVGIAFNLDTTDADALLHAADTALYEAKRAGKGRVSVCYAGPAEPVADEPSVSRPAPARPRS